MNDTNEDLMIPVLLICVLVVGMMIGAGLYAITDNNLEDEKTRWQQEAVDNNAAYWCIVDHEKIFSWKPCDKR